MAETVPKPTRLAYLDGLRGLAALYVAVHHGFKFAGVAFGPAERGWVAVDVFFVLSGFVLMWPAARAGGLLKGGIGPYLNRRARRILPPYYVALAFSLLLVATVPVEFLGTSYAADAAPITPGVVVSHALLVHCLRGYWFFRVNPAFWSVSYEWLLYWMLPLLFLPAWRRVGSGPIVAVCFAAAAAPGVLPLQHTLAWVCGVFALGLATAGWFAGAERRGAIAVGWFVALVATLASRDVELIGHFGVATASALAIVGLDRPAVVPCRRFLESAPLASLGSFSYSLYLLHMPLMAILAQSLARVGLGPAGRLAIELGIGLPLILAVSWAFSSAFELPFLPSHAETGWPARLQERFARLRGKGRLEFPPCVDEGAIPSPHRGGA